MPRSRRHSKCDASRVAISDATPGSTGGTSRPSGHALVVGGTGMLAGTSLALAREGQVVTVVARDPERLSRLRAAASSFAGEIRPLALDYNDQVALKAALSEVQDTRGAFHLVVCWMHDTVTDGPVAVAEAILPRSRPCRFFHILGSATRDPTFSAKQWAVRLSGCPGLAYRQVILGFVRAGRRSRWLEHHEITEGVKQASKLDSPSHIIGTIRPWAARPSR